MTLPVIGNLEVLVQRSHPALRALEFTLVGVGDLVAATNWFIVPGARAEVCSGFTDQSSENHYTNSQKHG